ncbi:hypothetical protein BH09BAC2_BH09BAC2_03100 [soil metagenome]
MKGKKIAVFGNMNNTYLNLTRYLRDAGYAATLFICKGEPEHFAPDCDMFSDDYKQYTVNLKWGQLYDLLHVSAEEIKKQFAGYDFFIGSGYAPAYLHKAGITLDLFFVYGWDLYQAPFFRIHNPLKTINFFHNLLHQRAGIRASKNMSVGDPSPFYDKMLKKAGFKGKRFTFSAPHIYEPDYNPENIEKYYPISTTYASFKQIRDQYDFVIFHNTRQIWTTRTNDVSIKDNDQLFKGVQKAKQLTDKTIAVIAFEYGSDYKDSQKLCKDLNIDTDVFWMPLSPRKELMIGMSLCDVVAGEFKNSWLTYGVVVEAMAAAKPIIHNRIDSLYADEDLYPMLSARNEHEIKEQILFAINNPEKMKEMGRGANEWYKKRIAERTVTEITKLIGEKIKTQVPIIEPVH